MTIVESTAKRLVLQSGSTTLTLDKGAGKMALQHKALFWKPKPAEAALSDIADVKLETVVDRASGVELYHTALVTKTGAGWFLPASDKAEAEANAAKLRNFIGLKH